MDIVDDYIAVMDQLVVATDASRNMLHVHAGMAIYLGVQFFARNRRASPLALGIVVTIELLNEAMQRLYYGSWRWGDTISDILLTIFWPAAITALGLYRRRRWAIEQKIAKACSTGKRREKRTRFEPA